MTEEFGSMSGRFHHRRTYCLGRPGRPQMKVLDREFRSLPVNIDITGSRGLPSGVLTLSPTDPAGRQAAARAEKMAPDHIPPCLRATHHHVVRSFGYAAD
jgi:hypothetical protein